MGNLEKLRLETKVKIASLRNRGNVVAIAEELNLDLELVSKIVRKLRKRDERDVSHHISTTLMQHLFEGREMRLHYFLEMLKDLDSRHQVTVSLCCSSKIGKIENSNLCLKCHKPCEAITLDQLGIYQLKQDLLKEMREEDATMLDFAIKMGYVSQEQAPAVQINDKRQYLVMPGGDPKLVQDLQKMTPMQRDQFRLDLEKEVLGDGPQKKENS